MRKVPQKKLDQISTFLKAHYPLAFGKYVPLAVGIDKEIFANAPELPRNAVRTYLWQRCTANQYRIALQQCEHRVHLTGEDAGPTAARVKRQGD